MAILPAFCDNCGAVWGAKNVIGGTAAKGIQFTGTRVGPCPNCGGMGRVPDGVYDLMNDTLTVVESAGLPPASLQGIIALLESAARGEATDSDVMAKVEKEAPALAPVVNVYLEKPDRVRWILLLIAVLSALMQGPGTVNEVSKLLAANPRVAPSAPPQVASDARREAAAKKKKTRAKRSPKTHGKSKKRRPRRR